MGRITLYVSSQTPDRIAAKQGDWAKQVLDGKRLPFMEVDVSMMQDQLENMYKLSLGLNKHLPQLYFNNKIVAFGPTTQEKLDALQEQGKFDAMVKECLAAPDPVNPPYVGIWHPGDGSGKLVLEWKPEEEEYSSSGDDEHMARKADGSSSFVERSKKPSSSSSSGGPDRHKKKRRSKHQRERDRRNKETGKSRSSGSSSKSSTKSSSSSKPPSAEPAAPQPAAP
jgi:hypothetical protein